MRIMKALVVQNPESYDVVEAETGQEAITSAARPAAMAVARPVQASSDTAPGIVEDAQ